VKNVSATFIEPLDTYCDMSHLIKREGMGSGVRAIGYFCGVLPDPPGKKNLEPAAATERARRNALSFLKEDARALWPNAHRRWRLRWRQLPGTEVDWNLLFDPDNNKGELRFGSQYWRGNVAAWDRYVTTPAGSVAYRLRANESGFTNLVLAGDWTRNGIDGGCVEAAVRSGIQAAHAIEPPTGPDRTADGNDKWLDPP
jgi:hypothetical protein